LQTGVVDGGVGAGQVEVSSLSAWAYWKCVASRTTPTEKEPSKFVLLVLPAGKPLMSTVPGLPGLRLWAADVVMVTRLEARVALETPTDPTEGLARFTAES